MTVRFDGVSCGYDQVCRDEKASLGCVQPDVVVDFVAEFAGERKEGCWHFGGFPVRSVRFVSMRMW